MFYTVAMETEKIVGIALSCPDPQVQADLFECEVYIIEGQDMGLSAKPTKEQDRKETT